MNRAQRRRGERTSQDIWNKVVTGREVVGMMDSYDHVAVAPMRYLVDMLVMWNNLPIWKRAWLRIRGDHPFKTVPSLVEQAQAIGAEGEGDAGGTGT